MSTLDWVVLAAGAAALLWVNWYFFLADRRQASSGSSGERAGQS